MKKIEDPYVKAITTRSRVQVPEIIVKRLITIMNKIHTTNDEQVDESA